MSFPTSPTDGQTYNGYKYDAALTLWKKDVATKDDMFPIGMLYTQYPGESSPQDLGWPGTWTNISSNFAGDFFRAEGGNASTFEGGRQAATAIENGIYHQYRATINDSDGSYSGGTLDVADHASNAPWSGNTAYKVRPVNRTIRIWKRTA